MKVLTIGDIHGRTAWKDFADIPNLLSADENTAGTLSFVPEYDKYIFAGDYTDSFDVEDRDILMNLLHIIRFKRLYPNHVILLWGNHDVSYYINQPWLPLRYWCSGFRGTMHHDLYTIFNESYNYFQLSFQIDKYIWTHAGIHDGWYRHRFLPALKDFDNFGFKLDTLSDKLNFAFDRKMECIFDVDPLRGGTGTKVGGPLWLHKSFAIHKPLTGYHQITGHNPVRDIETIVMKNRSITLCDCLGDIDKFYTLNIIEHGNKVRKQ